MKKNLFQKVLYWTLFPALVVVVTALTAFLTESLLLGGVAGLIVFVIYKIIRGVAYDSYEYRPFDNGDQEQAIVATLVASWTVLLFFSPAKINTFGVVGGFLLAGALLIFIVLYISHEVKDSKFNYVIKDLRVYLSVIAGCFLLGVTAQMYLFFGTQYIWVPTAMALFVSSFFDGTIYNLLGRNVSRLNVGLGIVGISVVASIVSTIIEFGNSIGNGIQSSSEAFMDAGGSFVDFLIGVGSAGAEVVIYHGYNLWHLLGLITLGFIIFCVVKKINNNRKKRLLEEERQLENEKQNKLLQEKKEFQEQQKEQKVQQKRVEAQKLYKQLNEAKDKISWYDLSSLDDAGVNFPKEWILKAEFIDLIKHSDIKMKIVFDGVLQFAAHKLEGILNDQDDVMIKKVIEQIKQVEKFSQYEGYEALKIALGENKGYYWINRLAPLKEPDSKKREIENV